MKRIFLLLAMMGLAAGCSTVRKPGYFSEATDLKSGISLNLNSEEERSANLHAFFEGTRGTEFDKISYLLESIREADITFVRNGQSYNGEQAMKWLRWKMYHRQYHNHPILTADDFVNRVCVRSNKTGIPYEILTPDGRRVPVQVIMNHELQTLEKAIHDRLTVAGKLPAAQ